MKKTSYLLGLCTLMSCGYLKNVQKVSDVQLAAAIKNDCPECIDNNNKLTAEAKELEYLTIEDIEIKDWSGFDFPALKMFRINRCKFESLPLHKLPNVDHFDCSNNGLTSLPEPLPKTLEKLICNTNRLTSLPAVCPPTLRFIDYSFNQFTSLPDTLPNTLVWISFANNALTSLPEQLPPNLYYLNCANNPIEEMLAFPESLRTLNLTNTKVSCLPDFRPVYTEPRLPVCKKM